MSEPQQYGKPHALFLRVLLLLCLAGLVPSVAAQSGAQDGRITDAVNEGQLIELIGHVNPLVRSALPGAVVSGDLPMERMMLLLGGSQAQQQSLEKLLVEQQDPASSDYRHWLTPREFGEQFGSGPQDVETITAWLRGHGFRVNAVAQGRSFIEFSGTAAQVAEAFHTQINSYIVEGKQYWANATNPYIPAALAPVVKGIASLNNFPRRAMHHMGTQTSLTRTNATATPEFNLSNGTHAVGPYDFATIYDVLPLWNASPSMDGTGQTIAIVARSNIDPGDISDFQSLFGLSLNPPQIIVNGADPGILRNSDGTLASDAVESELDVQWSGAVAKSATILLVVSASTNTADGVDLSSAYIVDNNLAPVLSMSYESCEQDLQGSQFYTLLWQQAAAQGVSVFVSAGDSGSAGCDDPSSTNATQGLAVSGLASTPYNVAVGGTQFNENGDSTYWASTPDAHLASANRYIPEVVWNSTTVADPSAGSGLWAGGGGVSTLYTRPSWQTGTGVPATDPFGSPGNAHRLLPDVSLATSADHDGYVVCLNRECPGNFSIYGGTSISSPAFAGLMAIVNQYTDSIQGNPNFHFYPLSNTTGVYHDVTSGTNAVPCAGRSSGCSSTQRGVSGAMDGYSAGAGYDLASGWGSVDANALVSNWSSVNFTATTTTASVTSSTTFQHGSSLSYQLTVAPTSGSGIPSGRVTVLFSGNGVTEWTSSAALNNGSASATVTPVIPGGTSVLTVRYGGDGTYGSSNSAGINLTVTPEPSFMTLTGPSGTVPANGSFQLTATVTGSSRVGTPTGLVTFLQAGSPVGSASLDSSGIATGTISSPGPGQYTYSASYAGDSSFSASLSANSQVVTFAKASVTLTVSASYNQAIVGAPVTLIANLSSRSATGTVQFLDNGIAIGAPVSVSSGTAQYTTSSLALGAHAITASYSGNTSFNSSTSAAFNLSVVQQAMPVVSFSANFNPVSVAAPGSGLSFTVQLSGSAIGPAPTGTLSILDGSTPVWTAVASVGAGSVITLNTPTAPFAVGTHNLTLTYSGDANWLAVSSNTITVTIANSDFALPATMPSVSVARGGSTTVFVSTSGIAGFSGTLTFSCSGLPAETSYSFNPPAPSAGTGTYLTITTSAPSTASLHEGQRPRLGSWRESTVLTLGVVLLAGARRKQRYWSVVLALVLAGLLIAAVGCGGGGGPGGGSTTSDPGTPAGTYTVTVTATSGALTHRTQFSLTVN